MLKHLTIRNLAVVERADLEFGPGMTVLTGETGAGKSILLDALGLALGDRADSALVRHGAERGEVTADFAIEALPTVAKWLQERELDSDDECLIRRTVGADGRSRGYINAQPVPVQALRELGEQLVDIQGQHAHQSLLRRPVQRQLLDAFGGHERLLAEVGKRFDGLETLRREYEHLREAALERDARLDLLRYQCSELEALNPNTEELEALEEEHGRLANASRLLEGAQRSAELLQDSEDGACTDLLTQVLRELEDLERFDAGLAGTRELVANALIQVQEAGSEMNHYLAGMELDPARLDWVEQRLADLQAVARKHRTEPEALAQLLAQMQGELADLENADARLEGMAAELESARSAYDEAAGKLSKARAKAAKKFAKEVGANMHDLGMGEGRFEVALRAREDGAPSAHGAEQVEFLVTANAGQPPRPLQKVASGGELSRISLAIQVITATREGIPTLIFDEVDVGVGGGVAERVGRQLRRLSAERQVMCVTHQPQVAALGHHHFGIDKESAKGATRTRIASLDEGMRIEEVARMLGGIEITEQTESHAREMLQKARG